MGAIGLRDLLEPIAQLAVCRIYYGRQAQLAHFSLAWDSLDDGTYATETCLGITPLLLDSRRPLSSAGGRLSLSSGNDRTDDKGRSHSLPQHSWCSG